MRRSELIALITMISLLVIGGALIGGAVYTIYIAFTGTRSLSGALNVALFGGGFLAVGQGIVAGLAYWGLRLTRQNHELTVLPVIGETTAREAAPGTMTTFRMSAADDTHETGRPRRPAASSLPMDGDVEVKTLDTGFQRVVVMIAAVVLLVMAAITAYRTTIPFAMYAQDPGKGFPLPAVDPMVVTIAVGALLGYVALFAASKVQRGMEGFGDAVRGLLTLGLVGMVVVTVSVFLSWMGVAYAAEVASGVVACVMAMQALELAANALRSYAGVEEFDQEPVDLQETPLVPMLSSVWIGGIQMLGGQMIGLGGAKAERGVLARMLPRVAVAAVILGVLASMVRVVPVGHVAVVERLGEVVGMDAAHPDAEAVNKNLLGSGIHITLPWPIDTLVLISNERVRSVDVGAELKPMANVKGMGFEFWNVPHAKDTAEGRFITGDINKSGQADPQLLESFATVYWRVKDAGKFYLALSHSEYFGKTVEGENEIRPIYEAIVQRVAEEAMTSSFAQNSAEQIMLGKRQKIEDDAKKVMQDHLDEKGLDCGIEIVQFTINDVHPPYGHPNEAQNIRGPAGAFEEVVSAMQDRNGSISVGQAIARMMVLKEKGDGDVKVLAAQQHFDTRKNGATETAAKMAGSANGYRDFPFAAKARLLYEMGEAMRPVQKIILGPGVRAPNVWQEPKDGAAVGGKP